MAEISPLEYIATIDLMSKSLGLSHQKCRDIYNSSGPIMRKKLYDAARAKDNGEGLEYLVGLTIID